MICSPSIISAWADTGQATDKAGPRPQLPNHQTRLIFLCLVALSLFVGCTPPPVESVAEVWGRKGLDEGRFIKPRAIAIDNSDKLHIIDMTSRIQVFDRLGQLEKFWKTPECFNGKPCGISILKDGRIAIPDTHYFRVLFYTPEGELLAEQTIGGKNGRGEGEFGFLTDVAEDSKGNLYVSEYGDFDRIQKFAPDGKYICSLGAHGTETGQFLRPQGILIDDKDQLWVADACNHRIQVFDVTTEPPTFKFTFGSPGSDIGQLNYPYNMLFDDDGFLYVCEFGNHRLQKFDAEGNSQGVWGGPGREPGQLHQPWGMTLDSNGYFHVIDSYNHRVQRFKGVALPGEQPVECWTTAM